MVFKHCWINWISSVKGLRYGTWFSTIGLSIIVKRIHSIDLKPEDILNKENEFSKIIEF